MFTRNPQLISRFSIYSRNSLLNLTFLVFLFLFPSVKSFAGNLFPQNLVTDEYQSGFFPLVTDDSHAVIYYDKKEHKGAIRSIMDLQTDIERVTHHVVQLSTNKPKSKTSVIIGTLGNSKYIDRLVKSGKLDIDDLDGKWESFVITTIEKPFSNTDRALVIAGSDMRGTIYGVYELSQQLGVSPWYWWADVPVINRKEVYVRDGYFASGEPKIKYRGIFINDEIPCMKSWAKEKFGGMNSKMYAHVFELLLRLKANYLWPGMWGSFKEYNPGVHILYDEHGEYEGISFNEDDPENPRLANEYGIIMGTSHHEPMQRSQQEWIRNSHKYGNGEWNYVTNKEGLRQYFREGMENTKNYESIITLGMRGNDDEPMVDAGSIEANFKILEGIIADQRSIIEDVTAKPANQTPQVWTLYKEVLDYYDLGLKVPDDVIILLCDDDWGDIRYLPELNSEVRPGGYGMYYHVAYYGAPRSSKWLSNSQIQHMWEQLQLTYAYGVDKIWILNVGDIKPCEYPMDFFLKMAWNPTAFNHDNLIQYAQNFAAQQFGEEFSEEAARILNAYCKYSARMFAEMLDEKTYNLETGEYEFVKNEFLALETHALRQFMNLPEEYKDSYKQLILYPVQAMANLYEMYYSLAMNKKLANEKDLAANFWADRVKYCFDRDAELSYDYNHKMSNGKWNHMMDQVHIGYTTWHPPKENIRPEVIYIKPEEAQKGSYVFQEKNGVVVMEAEHYYQAINNKDTEWIVIPDLGRTLSGLALFPYTELPQDASLLYKMRLTSDLDSVKVRIIFDCTLPFKKGGHAIQIGFDGAPSKIININEDLTWKNNYTKMYPAAGERIIEKEFILELPSIYDELCTLTVKPLDPGIVFHKIMINCGGYEKTHLKMNESPYVKELN